MTQEEVAKRLSMAQSNYARMERGLSQLTVERLEELAAIFEMSPEAVLSYSGPDSGDFKEDAQYYYSQVKKLEAKLQKAQNEIERLQQDDSDSYERQEKEKSKQQSRLRRLQDEIASKDSIIKDKQALIDKLEKEIENKQGLIDHLTDSNTKLIDSNAKLLDRMQS